MATSAEPYYYRIGVSSMKVLRILNGSTLHVCGRHTPNSGPCNNYYLKGKNWCHCHGGAKIHENVKVLDENGNLVETGAAAVPTGHEHIIGSSREPLLMMEDAISSDVEYPSQVPFPAGNLFEVTDADDEGKIYDSAYIKPLVCEQMEVDSESRKRSALIQSQPKVRMIEGTSMVSVNDKIDGLAKNLHTLKCEIGPFADFLRKHAGSIEGREGVISDRVGRIDAQIRVLNETSDRVCTVNDQIRSEHMEIAKSLDYIREQLHNLTKRVGDVETETEHKLNLMFEKYTLMLDGKIHVFGNEIMNVATNAAIGEVAIATAVLPPTRISGSIA